MRICCVVGCGNSTYHLNKWMKTLCQVHKCNLGTRSCDCEPPFKLFPFPTENKNPELRKKWMIQVNRIDPTTNKNWTPKAHDRVCSNHFEECTPYPSVNLGHTVKTTVRPSRKIIVKHQFQKKSKSVSENTSTIESSVLQDIQDTNLPAEDIQIYTATPYIDYVKKSAQSDHCYTGINKEKNSTCKEKLQSDNHLNKSDHSYASKCDCSSNCVCKGCFTKQQTINKLNSQLIYLQQQLHSKGTKNMVHTTMTNNIVKDDSKTRLYTGLPNADVFDRLYKHLLPRAKRLTYWSGSKKITVLKYSLKDPEIWNYKHKHGLTTKKNNTLKFLVAMAPNGSISYISEAYGGRASDRFIVMDSGFLNLIDPTDEVMADRGFPIQSDLVMRQAKLIIPPPGQGSEQMTKENVLKTKAVANVRIHVERAIGRIKCFQILKNTLPITLVPLANEIFTICSAVSNLQPPLVK
ncbi:unnamed protein product [Mytilus edulis]|uniref:THAP-type domain-containing protein n=1 Tax=Mytilus edulis TaxID=6550 RepID=A0A8S3Q749_MYTED|nr:unnamed protein product [Mytilus edulis]